MPQLNLFHRKENREAQFKKGSLAAKAWGRKMARLRANPKRKHPHHPRKKKLKIRHISHSIRRRVRMTRKMIAHPIKTIKHYRRRRYIRHPIQHSKSYNFQDVTTLFGTLSVGFGSILHGNANPGNPHTTPPNPPYPGGGSGSSGTGLGGSGILTPNPPSSLNPIVNGLAVTLLYSFPSGTSIPTIVTVNWGDGMSNQYTWTQLAQNPTTHTYNQGGNYTITMSASYQTGQPQSTSTNVTLSTTTPSQVNPPAAQFPLINNPASPTGYSLASGAIVAEIDTDTPTNFTAWIYDPPNLPFLSQGPLAYTPPGWNISLASTTSLTGVHGIPPGYSGFQVQFIHQ